MSTATTTENLEQILTVIFNPKRPEGFVPAPEHTPLSGVLHTIHCRQGHFTVNFLDTEYTPQNCAILAKGDAKRYRTPQPWRGSQSDYQTHYVLRHISGLLLECRVCAAADGCGYAAYAVGSILSEERLESALKRIELMEV